MARTKKKKGAGRPRGSTAERSARKLSTVQARFVRARKVLTTGTVLFFDPSVHSKGSTGKSSNDRSQPGWCIYRAGVFVASGVISLDNPQVSTQERLYEISRILREEMTPHAAGASAGPGVFDAIVHEDPPLKRWIPVAGSKKSFGSVAAQLPLHYAVAALFCSLRTPRWLKMAPQIWRQFMPEGYEKTDEGDAVMLAVATYALLARDEHARAAARLGGTLRRPRARKKTQEDGT